MSGSEESVSADDLGPDGEPVDEQFPDDDKEFAEVKKALGDLKLGENDAFAFGDDRDRDENPFEAPFFGFLSSNMTVNVTRKRSLGRSPSHSRTQSPSHSRTHSPRPSPIHSRRGSNTSSNSSPRATNSRPFVFSSESDEFSFGGGPAEDILFRGPSPQPEGNVREYLTSLPLSIIHRILFLLDDSDRVYMALEDMLVPELVVPSQARKMNRDMLNFVLTSKKIYEAAMKRGGLPSVRPLFCLRRCARMEDAPALAKLMDVVGKGPVNRFVDNLLIETLAHNLRKQEGLVALVELLLSRGAQPNVTSFFGRPIHIAARRGRMDVCECLIEYGADPTLEDPAHGHDAFACSNESGFQGTEEALRKIWKDRKK